MNSETSLRHTPLVEDHVQRGARMVPFAGWLMPVRYSSVLEETQAVRQRVGAFDISHMGRLRLAGPGAAAHLQRCLTNDIQTLNDGAAQYTLLLAENGGVLDDLIVYRLQGEEFLIVVNAVNADRDLSEFQRDMPTTVQIHDATAETAMIAVQGPDAAALVGRWAGFDPHEIGRFHVAAKNLLGSEVLFCRTGYTGEDGFEIVLPAGKAVDAWHAIIAMGAVPCGLGARDTLRIEAGYPLYGHEIHEGTNPVEAGLMWAVKLAKGPFRGRDAVAAAKQNGVNRKLMGLIMSGRMVPRQGCLVTESDTQIGEVTSGTFSPSRGAGLGMAYIATAKATVGRSVLVQIRGSSYVATLVRRTDLLDRSA